MGGWERGRVYVCLNVHAQKYTYITCTHVELYAIYIHTQVTHRERGELVAVGGQGEGTVPAEAVEEPVQVVSLVGERAINVLDVHG